MEIKEYEAKYLSSIFTINQLCHKKPQSNLGLLEQIHKGQTWIAIEGDTVVGFLVSTWKEGPYVYNIAVLPDYRNKGTATKLLETFHWFYREQHFYYLYVEFSNPAQKLYFDLGYRVKNIKRDFYGHDQDALVMYKVSDSCDCSH